ncbi:alpha/beta fold hydrolase [Nocardioides limicola]|uniref:alpha/beta fold hydrolase n=1 Tax=Nocardioides limicola TaxID=2803368 RepID=UPI00193B6CA7|nr:alpha/beta fold hydrolase [Nocardioides sp. DJM-14]
MTVHPTRRSGAGGVTLAMDTFTPTTVRPTATVVVLHGGGQSREQWRDVGLGLAAAGLRAVTVDLRGHGESDWSPSGSYRLEDFVADLELIIDDLVNDLAAPIILAGHSHGGKVVLTTAGRRTAAVAGVVLIDSLPDMEPDWSVNEFYQRTAAGFGGLDEAAAALAELVGRPMTPAGLDRGLRHGEDGRWYWNWDTRTLDAVADGLTRDRVVMNAAARQLKLPALLLRTEESPFLNDENVARLQDAIPHAAVQTMPDTQHHRPWQHPGLVVNHLSEFVATTRRRPPEAELLYDVDSIAPLFQPFRLGELELTSRVVMAPMTRNFCPDGVPGPDVVDYYARRAAAGVGLIISEGIYVPHRSAGTYPDVPEMAAPGAVEAWRRVTDRVHAEGARILAQLWHVGGVRRVGKPPFPDAPVVTPSGLDLRGRDVGEPLGLVEIDEIVAAYASAAADAMAAGFDGVEIHGAHGYLIDEFHWGQTNLREDHFSGDIGDRSTLGARVTAAVREAIGPQATLSYRFSQWKLTDYNAMGAADPDELARMLEPIVAAGASVLHPSTRRYWTPAFEGSDRTLAGWTRHLTGLPVIAVGSIGVTAPARSEETDRDGVSLAPLVDLVTSGEVDLVAVGRALVSDPEWASKVRDRRPEAIRWYRKEHEAELY